MPISVPIDMVEVNAPIPPTLVPYITPIVWSEITHAKSVSYSNTQGLACGIEWLTCLLCCIPLCLCHTCIQPSLAQGELNNAMFRINQAHFQSRSVCQCTSQYLVISYESIAPTTTTTTDNQIVPVMAQEAEPLPAKATADI